MSTENKKNNSGGVTLSCKNCFLNIFLSFFNLLIIIKIQYRKSKKNLGVEHFYIKFVFLHGFYKKKLLNFNLVIVNFIYSTS